MADASIPSKTAEFIDKLQQGKNADAGEAFKDALRDKVASALDKQRAVSYTHLTLPTNREV